MPSNASAREIWYHPNANLHFVVHGVHRARLVDKTAAGGPTVATQIAEQINQGAIDKRPGAPGQVIGSAAVAFLEGLKELV